MNFQPENEKELAVAVKLFKHMNNNRDPFRKIIQLRSYFQHWGIKKVVVGVSGGVDSALVLAMLTHIPEVSIYAVNIAFDTYSGVFDKKYITILREHFMPYMENNQLIWDGYDLSKAHDLFQDSLRFTRNTRVDAQTSYAMRYLAFFTYAQQLNAVTIGTTNYDEFGYAGWFGKTSDMMVDVQPIADLHKFEVVSWARLLGVPEEICTRTPTGDLIDGTTDEENFGCSYDELSYFTDLMREKVSLNSWMMTRFEKLIQLHERSAHKYQGQGFNPVFLTG